MQLVSDHVKELLGAAAQIRGFAEAGAATLDTPTRQRLREALMTALVALGDLGGEHPVPMVDDLAATWGVADALEAARSLRSYCLRACPDMNDDALAALCEETRLACVPASRERSRRSVDRWLRAHKPPSGGARVAVQPR